MDFPTPFWTSYLACQSLSVWPDHGIIEDQSTIIIKLYCGNSAKVPLTYHISLATIHKHNLVTMDTVYTVASECKLKWEGASLQFLSSLRNTFTELFCNFNLRTPLMGHKELTKCQYCYINAGSSPWDHTVSVTDFSFYI